MNGKEDTMADHPEDQSSDELVTDRLPPGFLERIEQLQRELDEQAIAYYEQRHERPSEQDDEETDR